MQKIILSKNLIFCRKSGKIKYDKPDLTCLKYPGILVWLNYQRFVKKQKENLWDCGTIKCATTIPKPHV